MAALEQRKLDEMSSAMKWQKVAERMTKHESRLVVGSFSWCVFSVWMGEPKLKAS